MWWEIWVETNTYPCSTIEHVEGKCDSKTTYHNRMKGTLNKFLDSFAKEDFCPDKFSGIENT